MRRLPAWFTARGDTLHVSDVSELVPVIDGAAGTDRTTVTRSVTWSLRPDDMARAVCTIVGRDLRRCE